MSSSCHSLAVSCCPSNGILPHPSTHFSTILHFGGTKGCSLACALPKEGPPSTESPR